MATPAVNGFSRRSLQRDRRTKRTVRGRQSDHRNSRRDAATLQLPSPKIFLTMTDSLQQRVRELLATITDPHTGQSLVAEGAVKGVGAAGKDVAIDIALAYPAAGWHDELADSIRNTLAGDASIGNVIVNVTSRVFAHKVQKELNPLPNVK